MRFIRACLSVVIMILSASMTYAGGSTEFNYQGRLLNAGEPANGLFDFEFRMWDADVGGSQIGLTQIRNGVSVADGLFTVPLDFGANAFDNADRWLGISVDGVPLAPRLPVTRVPYAIQTRGIFVDEDQNVGIGTTNPLASLHVDGEASTSVGLYLHAPGQSTGDVIIGSPAGSPGISGIANNGNRRDIRFTDGGIGLWTRDSPSMPFSGNGMFIDESGNVGIGTTAPEYPLHVVGDGQPGMHVLNTGDSILPFGIWAEADTPGGRAVYGVSTHSAGSNYGVFGTSAGSNGTGVFGLASAVSGVTYGVRGETHSQQGYGVYSNGDVCTTGSYLNCSDARFKQNVQPLADSLDKILKLRGVQFDWKRKEFPDHSFSQDRQIGFIAQEVAEVLPELVAGSEGDDEFFSVSYVRLVPVLVEAIKELNGYVEQRDSQIMELQARLTSLETMVEQLTLQIQGGAK